MIKSTHRLGAVAALSVLALSLTACGSDSTDSSGTASNSGSVSTPSTSPSAAEDMSGEDMASGLVGAGCADYAAQVPSGSGSVAGMAQDPVATAASNNPLLKTLVSAVSGQLNPEVDLVDTLNGGEFTVFAPVDAAFAEVPAETIAALQSDSALLTKVLTYHVVPGQIAPTDIAGMQTTVEGQDVNVTGSGDTLKVNDASVICGGVKTANATVYLIDGVLTPPAA